MNTNSHATSICKCIEIETCTHTHETRPVYKIGSSKSYKSYVREQVGLVLQLPLARQVTVGCPERWQPVLHMQITVPPNVVLVGVPGDPLEIEGRVESQEMAIIIRGIVVKF